MNKLYTPLVQQVPRRAGRTLALFLALPLAACDNVEWGGIRVQLHEPQYERLEVAPTDTAAELPPLELPAGPVAFHVRRLDSVGRATIRPVVELGGEDLRAIGPRQVERAEQYTSAFVSRYYNLDQAYHLFRSSARVGTFYVTAPAVTGTGLCLALEADGRLELRPGADTLSEFVAWSPGQRAGAEYLNIPEYRPDMPTLAGVLARLGVREGGLSGAWRFGAPADLRALTVGSGPRGFAATFMVGDSLGLGSPPDSAGTVFLVADFDPSRGYFPLYFSAEWYAPGQKRALRWVDQVDVTGDTAAEWLVRAYGDVEPWFELVGTRAAERQILWSGRRPVCEARQPIAANR